MLSDDIISAITPDKFCLESTKNLINKLRDWTPDCYLWILPSLINFSKSKNNDDVIIDPNDGLSKMTIMYMDRFTNMITKMGKVLKTKLLYPNYRISDFHNYLINNCRYKTDQNIQTYRFFQRLDANVDHMIHRDLKLIYESESAEFIFHEINDSTSVYADDDEKLSMFYYIILTIKGVRYIKIGRTSDLKRPNNQALTRQADSFESKSFALEDHDAKKLELVFKKILRGNITKAFVKTECFKWSEYNGTLLKLLDNKDYVFNLLIE